MDLLSLIGRDSELFSSDIESHEDALKNIIQKSRFMIIGGAGTIGQSVTREIFKRDPRILHVVDISENNMVELVRDLRSTEGYGSGEFKTFAIDCGSLEFEALVNDQGPYDFVFNLSALKHVRSEKDPFTLMRMIIVNIFNTVKTLRMSKEMGAKKYFCVSTDKAANPVNMMGASKRIMEMFLMRRSLEIDISTARFANVAFSDGSLLHGFNQRIEKRQPIVAPNDIKRYFVTPQESGELCLMSCIFGQNRDIFFPKLSEQLHLITFADIATKYLKAKGYGVHICKTEDDARAYFSRAEQAPTDMAGNWPCLFTASDTTGEKDFEEFYTDKEVLDMQSFFNLGVIKNLPDFDPDLLESFSGSIQSMKQAGSWTKQQIVDLFFRMLPDFAHRETGKYLDGKM